MILEDDSVMIFGEHKGKTLEEVPAKYLLWLEGVFLLEGSEDAYKLALLDYIEDNREVLNMELDTHYSR